MGLDVKALMDSGSLKNAVESLTEAVVFDILFPLAEKYVKESDSKWDDAALGIFKDLAVDLVNQISKEDGD